MDPIFGLLDAALTLVGVVTSAVLTKRISDRKLTYDAGQFFIDQLQKDVTSLRGEVNSLRRMVRIQDDYIGRLRRGYTGGGDLPPPWPDGLVE